MLSQKDIFPGTHRWGSVVVAAAGVEEARARAHRTDVSIAREASVGIASPAKSRMMLAPVNPQHSIININLCNFQQ